MLNDYDKSIDGNQRSGAERHSNRSNSNAARRKSGSPIDFKKSYARYVAMARAAALKGRKLLSARRAFLQSDERKIKHARLNTHARSHRTWIFGNALERINAL